MARTKERSRKRKPSEYASEDGFVENDSDGSDRPTKRTKPTTSSTHLTPLQSQIDSDGNKFWEISKMRRVTISEFKDKQMVSVREYYEQNGEIKPGKKGISMPMDQYSAFIELLPQIEKELIKKGQTVPRPQYIGQVEEERDVIEEEDSSEVGDDNGVPKKSNIEATSDEDED